MKKNIVIFLGILILVLAVAIPMIVLRFQEDSWIKDERGVFVEHGHPSNSPKEAIVQQKLIVLAKEKLNDFSKIPFETIDSQCLGSVEVEGTLYAVDLVHVPRTADDNLEKNQCADFRNGKISHFIELDKNGNVVKIF